MTWANPLLLFWGSVALLPLLLHLRMNRQPVVDLILPTFRFLSSSSFQAVRRKKIQEWFILFLRVLLLIGFSCLLARPALPHQQVMPLDRIAFVLDDSLSTSYEVHGRSIFQQIQIEAQTFLEKIPLSIPVGLYFTNGDFVDFTLDRSRLRTQLQQKRRLTHSRTFANVVHGITQQFHSSEQAEILLFTDRTRYALEGLHAHSFLKFVDCGLPENSSSTSITSLKIEHTGAVGATATIEFSGRFSTTQAFLKINGTVVQAQKIESPFQEKYQFLFVPTTEGIYHVEVFLEVDPLHADHHWYGAFFVKTPPKILLVGVSEQTRFLEKSLRVAGGFCEVVSPSELGKQILATFDWICIFDSPLYGSSEIAILENYVRQKKRFWYFPSTLPFSLSSFFSWPLPTTVETGPFLLDFQNDFLPEELLFLTPLEEFYPVQTSEKSKILLRLQDGRSLIIQEGNGIWFGFSPTLKNELFLFSPLFPILIYQLFQQFSARSLALEWPVGKPYPLPWEQKETTPIHFLLPNGEEVLSLGSEPFSETHQLGIYGVRQGEEHLLFCVNPDPNEFDLRTLSLAEILKKFGANCFESRYRIEEKEPEEWTPWIAYLLVIFLVTETCWSNRLYRRR